MYTLRPATDEDLDFLYEVHEVTMRDYVMATFGWWDASRERAWYDAQAESARVPAALRVLEVNAGARRSYQRLGFAVVGETERDYDMRYG